MRIYKTKLVERKKLQYIMCNKCGQNVDIKNYKDFLYINKTWGYNSNYDGEYHEFEICQSCYDELINSLKIKPSTKKRKKLFFL